MFKKLKYVTEEFEGGAEVIPDGEVVLLFKPLQNELADSRTID